MTKVHIQKLIEFSELHKGFMKSRKPSELEKQLFEMDEKFKEEHPEIKLNERSNVIDERTFAAHGTNAGTLFSAFAFTNGQLLPKNEMKKRGIPVVAGELICEKRGLVPGKHYPNTVSQNSVSTIGLHMRNSYLLNAVNYANMATKHHSYDYNNFRERYLKKYKKRGADENFLTKVNELFGDKIIQEAYKKLSTIPIVVLGNRIGGVCLDDGKHSIPNEYGCQRLNIRAIIVNEKDKEYVKDLVNRINPEIAKSIMYLTQEEIDDFENTRAPANGYEDYNRKQVLIQYKNIFVHDFSEAFKDKLTFSFSDQFELKKVKVPELSKKFIGGKYQMFTPIPIITYYQNPAQTSETINFDEDYSLAFTEPVQSNGDSKETSEQPVANHTTDTQSVTPTPAQQKKQVNGGVTRSETIFQQTPASNGTNNKGSLPHLDNTKHNSPQEQFLGISPRGWIIIGVAAIACAVALYLLAPLILGAATVGVGTKLGFGAAGAVVGGVLTGIAINKCCSGATLPNYTN